MKTMKFKQLIPILTLLLLQGTTLLAQREIPIHVTVIGLDGRPVDGAEILLVDLQGAHLNTWAIFNTLAYRDEDVRQEKLSQSDGPVTFRMDGPVDGQHHFLIARLGDDFDFCKLQSYGSTRVLHVELRPRSGMTAKLRFRYADGRRCSSLHFNFMSTFPGCCIGPEEDHLGQLDQDGAINYLRADSRFRSRSQIPDFQDFLLHVEGVVLGKRRSIQFVGGSHELEEVLSAKALAKDAAPKELAVKPLSEPAVGPEVREGPTWRFLPVIATAVLETAEAQEWRGRILVSNRLVREFPLGSSIYLSEQLREFRFEVRHGETLLFAKDGLNFPPDGPQELEVILEGLSVQTRRFLHIDGQPLAGLWIEFTRGENSWKDFVSHDGSIRELLVKGQPARLNTGRFYLVDEENPDAAVVHLAVPEPRQLEIHLKDSRILKPPFMRSGNFGRPNKTMLLRGPLGPATEPKDWTFVCRNDAFYSKAGHLADGFFGANKLPLGLYQILLSKSAFKDGPLKELEIGKIEMDPTTLSRGLIFFEPTLEVWKEIERFEF